MQNLHSQYCCCQRPLVPQSGAVVARWARRVSHTASPWPIFLRFGRCHTRSCARGLYFNVARQDACEPWYRVDRGPLFVVLSFKGFVVLGLEPPPTLFGRMYRSTLAVLEVLVYAAKRKYCEGTDGLESLLTLRRYWCFPNTGRTQSRGLPDSNCVYG